VSIPKWRGVASSGVDGIEKLQLTKVKHGMQNSINDEILFVAINLIFLCKISYHNTEVN
jgi:hypothetical protein